MKDLKVKIQTVFLPFIYVSIITCVVYGIVRWLFDFKLGLLFLNDDILNFWIPLVISTIVGLYWLRPRLRVLKLAGEDTDGYLGYQIISILAIVAPIIVSQHYLEKSAFNLIEINTVNEIESLPTEKYFKVVNYEVDRYSWFPFTFRIISGKNNEDLNYYQYYTCVFAENENIWTSLEYTLFLDNIGQTSDNYSKYSEFNTASFKDFHQFNFTTVHYFERISNSEKRDRILFAIKNNDAKINQTDQIILMPKMDSFENRIGNNFIWIFGTFGISAFVIFILIFIPKVDQQALQNFKNNVPPEEDDLKEILQFLNPKGPHKLTATVLLIMILVFLILFFLGYNVYDPTKNELLALGASRKTEVLSGEYWRIFTSFFIHYGILHFIVNLFGFGVALAMLEKVIGDWRLFFAIFLCALIDGYASIYWVEFSVIAGTSGAIYGLFGIIFVFYLYRNFLEESFQMMWISIVAFIVINFLFEYYGFDSSFKIGGFVAGLILGFIYVNTDKKFLKKPKFNFFDHQ
mgnify:CR=1 FL=1